MEKIKVVRSEGCNNCLKALSWRTEKVDLGIMLRCQGRVVAKLNGMRVGQQIPPELEPEVVVCPDFLQR